MMAGMDEPNPYESPKAALNPATRFQFLPKNHARFQSLIAVMFWLMVLQGFRSGHHEFTPWFCAIVFTLGAMQTILRE